MGVWILRRIMMSIVVIFGSLTFVFFILHLLPGDPAEIMLQGNLASPEMIESLRAQFGLDRPLGYQYWSYLSRTLQGDFGRSLVSHERVLPKLMEQLPATIALTLASMGIALVLGTSLGIASVTIRNRAAALAIRTVSIISISMPTFWTGILLLLAFSVKLHWFPSMGSGTAGQLVLPALTLGISGAGGIARMVGDNMQDVLNEPYVHQLRAKGLPDRLVMYKHALRHALIPVVTLAGMLTGEMLAGAVAIETVYSRQGIGRLTLDAILHKDFTVVQGAVLLTAVAYVAVNTIVDLSYPLINPRLRRAR